MSASSSGSAGTPVTEGQAVTISDGSIASGWEITSNALGLEPSGIEVTNTTSTAQTYFFYVNFTQGGTEVEVAFTGAIDASTVRATVQKIGFDSPDVVSVTDPANPNRFLIRVQEVSNLDEAKTAVASTAGAKILAGGQTLVPTLKFRLASPEALIDLGRVSDLRGGRDHRAHLCAREGTDVVDGEHVRGVRHRDDEHVVAP